jgi:hypothetical protein
MNIDPASVIAIEDPTRRRHNLAVAPTPQLPRLRAAFRMRFELFDMFKHSSYKSTSGIEIV